MNKLYSQKKSKVLLRFSLLSLFLFIQIFGFSNNVKELLKSYKNATDSTEKIFYLNELAWEYTASNTDSAEYYALKAINLITPKSKDYKKNTSFALGILGIVYDLKGKRDIALEYYHRSLNLKLEINDSIGIASTYTNIGALFFSQNNYNKALTYFKNGLNYEKGLNNNQGSEESYVNIGVAYKNLNYIDSALFYFTKAEEVNNTTNNTQQKANINSNLGSLYLKLKDYKNAEKALRKAVRLNRELENAVALSIALENLAQIRLYHKRFTESEALLNEAIKHAKNGGFNNTLMNIYNTLFELNIAKNDMPKAYAYKDTFEIYRDEIENKKFNDILHEIEAKYKLEKRKAEILDKEAQIIKEHEKSKRLVLLLILSLVSFIALLIIAILIRKARVALHKKNKIINQSLIEKEFLMREIHHRVKNNIQAVKSLLQLEKRRSESEEIKSTIEKLLLRIKAMTFIHTYIYQEDEIANPDIKTYINKLVYSIIDSFGYNKKPHTIDIHIEKKNVDIEHLMNLGVILNELITNSCKYGLKDGVLNLSITGKTTIDGYELTVSDCGSGIDNSKAKGFGSDLMQMMVQKLKGTIRFENNSGNGFSAILMLELR